MTTLNTAVRGQWVQFSILGGRINLDGSRVGNIQHNYSSFSQKDHLSIRTDNGEAAMTYEWSNSKEQLEIDVSGGSRIHFRRGPKIIEAKKDASQPKPPTPQPAGDASSEHNKSKNNAPKEIRDPVPSSRDDKNPAEKNLPTKTSEKGTTIDFLQSPQDKAILTIEIDGQKQILSGQTLWHLFILYPEESRKYLAPFAHLLLPNNNLAEQAEAIEASLLRNSSSGFAVDRANWSRWVVQLGDENFARREAADRSLRSANSALLVYLQQLDFDRLDAEQQFRIRRIIDAISVKISGDTPEQVASWLSGDSAIWLALLSRTEVSTRRIAAKQLAAMLEGPIPVNPEADPATQKTQIEQLRKRLDSLNQPEKL